METAYYQKNDIFISAFRENDIRFRVKLYRNQKEILSFKLDGAARISISDQGYLAITKSDKTSLYDLNKLPVKTFIEYPGTWHFDSQGTELFTIASQSNPVKSPDGKEVKGLVSMNLDSKFIQVINEQVKANPIGLYVSNGVWAVSDSRNKQIFYGDMDGFMGKYSWNKGMLGEMPETLVLDSKSRQIFVRHDFYKFKLISRVGFDGKIVSFKTDANVLSMNPVIFEDKLLIAMETEQTPGNKRPISINHLMVVDPQTMTLVGKFVDEKLPLERINVIHPLDGKFAVGNNIGEVNFWNDQKIDTQENTHKGKKSKKKVDFTKLNFRDMIHAKYSDYLPFDNKCADSHWFLNLSAGEMNRYSNDTTNIGVVDLIPIGELFPGKREYIALNVVWGTDIENYPVCIYKPDDQPGALKEVISSSIKNWFPCYFVYYFNQLLNIYWGFSCPGCMNAAKKNLKAILNNTELIRSYIKPFQNERFDSILDIMFKVINERDTKNHPEWDYIGFYRVADGDESYVVNYLEMIQRNTSDSEWDEFVKKWPLFSQPLIDAAYNYNEKNRPISLTPIIAEEYLYRKVFSGEYMTIYLKDVAKYIKENDKLFKDFLFGNLVTMIIEDKSNDIAIAEEYYKCGEILEQKSDIYHAVNAYENAIWYQSKEFESNLNIKAFKKLKDVAMKAKDENYMSYLCFLENKLDIDYSEITVSFNEEFSKYIPSLEKWSDLNFDHDFYAQMDVMPNFGLKDIYSIGMTGHDFLVCCVIPGVKRENYPIAIYSEEGTGAKVISSSIKNWFPSYLIYRINELLSYHWSCIKRGTRYEGVIDDLDSILNSKLEIIEVCKVFDNARFFDLLPTIFKVLEEKDTVDNLDWRHVEYYKTAEKDSYLAKYYELKDKNADKAEWVGFIKETPQYNYPLYSQFVDKNDIVIDKDKLNISPEVCLEVFKRNLSIDFKNIDEILKTAADICHSNKYSPDSPYFELIEKIAKDTNSTERMDLPEDFYKLGKSLLKKGKDVEAITAFSNAIYIYNMDCEGLYWKAFDEIVKISKTLVDPSFKNYIKEYKNKIR